ncbi:MAG: hypothetical protein IKQ91_01745 [Oscillospiraceae bacterium]|nr:hypothetical protein [Oscillospiraceae bacterium]MBR3448402.1 hypothetical protein [Oscillospiraceae bacterium]MBR4199985.1 hypothetical protein [Oscillospiraceae bacterium]
MTTDQAMTILLIFVCVMCITVCEMGSKTATKTAKRFWYSAIASQIGGLLLGMTDVFIVQVILIIATVIFFVLSIIFGVQLFKETRQRRSERDSLR